MRKHIFKYFIFFLAVAGFFSVTPQPAHSASLFDQIIKSNPDDHTARYFRNKSARYMLDGVSEGWNGIEKVESK